MAQLKKSWLVALALLLLLAIAAYLRLRALAYSSVQGDQSILLHIAMQFINTGKIPLAANKSSAGIMNPPLIAYMLALPLLIQRSLTAVHLFQAALGVTAVAVFALYTQQLFGWRVTLLATGLFAVNPWAVYYSRFIWNPNPIPLFSTLLLMSLLAYFVGNRHEAHLALAFLWLAAITQLHLSGLVLVGVVAVVMLLFWRRQPQKSWSRTVFPIIIGIGLALLLYWPFIQFERTVGFVDIQATVAALVGGATPVEDVGVGGAIINAASFLLVQELATGNDIWFAINISPEYLDRWQLAKALAQLLFIGSLIYAVTAPIFALTRGRKETGGAPARLSPRHIALIILAVWLGVPILLYLRHTVYLQNYYFLYIYPAPFLAAALLLDALIQQISNEDQRQVKVSAKQLVTHLAFIVPVLLLGLWQIQVYHLWFQQIEGNRIVPPRQAQHVEQAIATAREVLEEKRDCDLTIVAEGGTVERSSLAVMESFVYPTPVRYVDAQRGYIIPATCTLYMTAANSTSETWLMANGRLLPKQIQTGIESWNFYEVAGSTDTLTPKATWQNGLGLVDVNIVGEAAPDTQLTLNYTWQVLSPPETGTHYHFFNHFLDEKGQIVAQDDAPAIESLYWRLGDRLVTQFYLSLPPDLADGRYTVLLGLYTWPDLNRIPLVISNETTYLVTTMDIVLP